MLRGGGLGVGNILFKGPLIPKGLGGGIPKESLRGVSSRGA